MGNAEVPVRASSTSASPIAGANLKPCPEKPAAKMRLGTQGDGR